MAIAQVWSPRLEASRAVPVRVEKRFVQPRQRKAMVLWAQPVWTLMSPQRGQAIPLGQRTSRNHCSVVSSSGKMRNSSATEMPSRPYLPGAVTEDLLRG